MSLFQTYAHNLKPHIFLVSLLLCEYAASMEHECIWFSLYSILLKVNLSDPSNDKLNCMYRVIHKSLRDIRPLQYSSWDGHAEGEHVNRGRDTPSFSPTLQVLHISFLLCLSWLLLSWVQKFRRDLWITLYINLHC